MCITFFLLYTSNNRQWNWVFLLCIITYMNVVLLLLSFDGSYNDYYYFSNTMFLWGGSPDTIIIVVVKFVGRRRNDGLAKIWRSPTMRLKRGTGTDTNACEGGGCPYTQLLFSNVQQKGNIPFFAQCGLWYDAF